MMTNIRAVILDIDGTLVDSNDAHAQAWVDAFKDQGYQVPFEKVRPLIGMGGDQLLPKAAGLSKESEEGQRIDQQRAKIFKQRYLPYLKAFPEVPALLERMQAAGFELVVATSAKEDELEKLLKIAGADSLIQAQTSADDADNSKPEPDIVQAALDKMEVGPDQVVMLGDTPYDIEAARRAGVRVIALRCGGWDDQGLKGAIAIYDDPADLLAHFESSPLANNQR
jgi:HAD superfamily hydrolase (TIGR01549 family)